MLTRTSERSGHRAAIYDLALSPTGFYSAAADGFIVHWHLDDVDLGEVVAKVEGGKFLCLATLEDGGFVAGALDGGVHWLYPEQEERSLHVAQHSKGVFAALRVDDEVFTGGGDGVLTRWNAKTGRTVESLPVSGNSLRSIAFYDYQDGLLIIGASDGKIHLVPLDFSDVISIPANQPSVFTAQPLPGPLATHVVSGGRDARLLFRELGFVRAPKYKAIEAHLGTINKLAFSPSGKYLATASRDKTVKLWDAETFELLKVAEVVRDRGHVNSVNTLLWVNDELLLTAGDDRRILGWKVG
ncbi:MAG: hypothetical protein AAF597_00995 [Bacteroidota bacterium]